MHTRIRLRLAAMALACVLAFGGCAVGNPSGTGNSGNQQNQVPPEPQLTLEDIRTAQLTDVPKDDNNYDTVCYVLYHKLMTAEDTFDTTKAVTRKDAVDALCRLTGKTGESTQPDAPLTREYLALMLYHAAEYLECLEYSTEATAEALNYPDAAQIQANCKTAFIWAMEQGLMRGFVGKQLLPDAYVSRLQLAQALVGLQSLNAKDPLALEIFQNQPVRNTVSVVVNNHEAIQKAVDAAAKKYGAIGLQVAVVENGTVVDTFAYGWATKNTDPMTADHKMRVASLSKIAVGLTAQVLREEGVVDLDAEIGQYWGITVKNSKYPNKPITLRSLLTHTSTLISYGDNESRDYKKVLARLQNGSFTGGVPGDIGYWYYNNYAYGVLGMTLELAANRTTDKILSEKLYAPMGIDAAFGAGDLKNTNLLTTLYRYGGEVARSVATQKASHSSTTPSATGKFFAGGLTISARDFAKLIGMLASDGVYEGVQILQPESVALMETLSSKAVPDGSYQALPMRYRPGLYGTKGIYFHTGSAYGVYNAATYDPETGNGVVVLSTGASGSKDANSIYKVCAEINQVIYDIMK